MSVATLQVLSPFTPRELIERHAEADRVRQGVKSEDIHFDKACVWGPTLMMSIVGLVVAFILGSVTFLGIGFGLGLGWGVANFIKFKRSNVKLDSYQELSKELNDNWLVQAPKPVAKHMKNTARNLLELDEARRADFRELWTTMEDSCKILRLDPEDQREISRIAKRAQAIRDVRKAELSFEQKLASDNRRALEAAREENRQAEIATLRSDDDSDLDLARCYARAMEEARAKLDTDYVLYSR